MKKALSIIDKISDFVGKAFSFLLPIIVLICTYEVISRYIFDKPTIWANELSIFIFIFYISMGACYVHKNNAHVQMDIFYNKFGPRGKAILGIIGSLLAFVFLGTLVWKGGARLISSIAVNEHSVSQWGPSLIPARFAIFFGAVLFLLQSIAKFIRDILVLVKEDDASEF